MGGPNRGRNQPRAHPVPRGRASRGRGRDDRRDGDHFRRRHSERPGRIPHAITAALVLGGPGTYRYHLAATVPGIAEIQTLAMAPVSVIYRPEIVVLQVSTLASSIAVEEIERVATLFLRFVPRRRQPLIGTP